MEFISEEFIAARTGGPLETRLKNSDTFQQQMKPTVWGLRMVCSLPLKEKSAEGSVLDVQDMTERVKLLTGQDKA